MPPKKNKSTRLSDPSMPDSLSSSEKHPDLEAHLVNVHAAVKAIIDHDVFKDVMTAPPLTILQGACHMPLMFLQFCYIFVVNFPLQF